MTQRNRRPSTGIAGALLASTIIVAVASLGVGAQAADPPVPQPAEWQDPLFTQPFIDVDEWRDTPVRHRYVHGGFKGSELLFSFYFPPKEQYQGRFFQPLAAVSGNELSAQSATGPSTPIGFAVASGAYLVQSNLGKKDMYPDPHDHTLNTILGYRASAAAAKYSKVLAAEMYGKHRTYGYPYGGSGGCFKTLSVMESTVGVWDGAVPFICPSPMAAPNIYTGIGNALRIISPEKMRKIADAVEPGGGDMYAGLTKEEAAALREMFGLGFPPRSLYKWDKLGMGALTVLMDHFKVWDPTYWTDFWKVKGYLGADAPESLKPYRIQQKTKITRVVMADEARKIGLPVPMAAGAAGEAGRVAAAFAVADLPKGELRGTGLIVRTGEELYISGVIDGLVTVGFGPAGGKIVNNIKVGDEVVLDNATWLAFQTYHRHQVPPKEEGYYVYDPFRGPDGKALYPQRPELKPLYPGRTELVSMRMNDIGGGSLQSGKYAGKMIVVQTMMDESASSWNADWYRWKVKQNVGDKVDDVHRLWHIDHGLHGQPQTQADHLHVINYNGALQQALRDVSAWAEKGVAPPATTTYKVVEGQVLVPPTAAERKGIQPVVALTVNGGVRADVAAGKPVAFSAVIEVPPGTGSVVSAEWDFEGGGDYPVVEKLTEASPRVTLKSTHTFTKPGTYFPVLRVASQRQGDMTSPHARVNNLGRVRVVVK